MPPHTLPIAETGRLLVALTKVAVSRIATHVADPTSTDLLDLDGLAVALNFPLLKATLDQFGPPPSYRAISSLTLSEIISLDKKASLGPFPPSRSLTSYWVVDTGGVEPTTTKLLNALLGVRDAVDAVYREQAVGPPPASAVNWSDDDFAGSQRHLDPSPGGIDAKWVWDQLQLDGAGIAFADVERGWNLNHEDLKGKNPVRLTPASWNSVDWLDHGTAAVGLVVGQDNDVGIVGIAPGVMAVRVASHWNGTVDTKVADAIALATMALGDGDVLLLEAQTDGNWPIELLAGDLELNAIKAATSSKGIVVIEPAGNRGVDLDAWISNWSGIYASGAIMVAASVGNPPKVGSNPHAPLSTSNAGIRVDCFAPGIGLISTGYGDLADTGPNKVYTEGFGETSGASAIIAGAAILAQHMHVAASGVPLGAVEMRSLLSDPLNGTPQGSPGKGNIGVMPNLRKIARSLVDVYLRDYIGDTGLAPSTGPLSSSPDIIVVSAAVGDPQGTWGEGSLNENSTTLSEPIIFATSRQIYVRVRNRGSCQASGVTATVYWSAVSTLVTPATWMKIGTSAAFVVPAGDVLTVSPPIPWPAAQIPGAGHYCFVAEVNCAFDPAPIPPAPTDWDGFQRYVRDFNNVTWRNFNVLDPFSLFEPGAQFWMRGAPDAARFFDFEIIQRLPVALRLVLEIPIALLGEIRGPHGREILPEREGKVARIRLSSDPVIRLPDFRLGQAALHECWLYLSYDDPVPDGFARSEVGSVAIRQLFEGEEVGRITWVLRPRLREAR